MSAWLIFDFFDALPPRRRMFSPRRFSPFTAVLRGARSAPVDDAARCRHADVMMRDAARTTAPPFDFRRRYY